MNLRTGLPLRRREGCSMAAYDRLPAPLRRWLAGAALPWSPASALRLWQRALARGEAPEAALARAEARTLARDRGRGPFRPA
jgi:hypothetical protein